MPDVVIHEVGPRDGLQMEKAVVPFERKLEWIRALIEAGLDIVQVGSFVHPVKVPQLADTDRLFAELRTPGMTREGVVLSALVLNEKGMERAFAAGVDLLCMGVSASETHSRRNTGMSIAEAAERIIAMAKHAMAAGTRVQVSVQSAFGCGYEGPVPAERVLGLVRRYVENGVTHGVIRRATRCRTKWRGCTRPCLRSAPALIAPATSTTRTASASPTSGRRCARA